VISVLSEIADESIAVFAGGQALWQLMMATYLPLALTPMTADGYHEWVHILSMQRN
jgi:hypothetical protein